jgi:hypothetical protein
MLSSNAEVKNKQYLDTLQAERLQSVLLNLAWELYF